MYLNLTANYLQNESVQELIEILKVNCVIEKIVLNLNSIKYRYVQEINKKTRINSINMRKQRMPAFKRQLVESKTRNEMKEMERVIKEYSEQEEEVQKLIRENKKVLEEVKLKESKKYLVMAERVRNVEEQEREIDDRLLELERDTEIIRDSLEKKLKEATLKLNATLFQVENTQTTSTCYL